MAAVLLFSSNSACHFG
ncbi:hypothetical protein F4V44_02450 [Niallia endozanthoxylica]|uniref:Uncharacterized protein n=1 Tax=Niallia endozanthoxylica TaxID=2036016 RepID=A0A5J5I8B8_9BACI|nr:hypothetical protein F4V44_02450 [Niallia endozanthoxylica]